MDHNIVALHGFLGRPSFWGNIAGELEKDDDMSFWSPDLYREAEFRDRSWISWPTQFEAWLESNEINGPIVLVGYSMGGRLALEFARRRPQWISHLVLISTRGGLLSENEVKQRLVWEAGWVKRFETEEPSQWLSDWNDQSVFAGSSSAEDADSKEISSSGIIDSFTGWALSSQVGDWDDLKDIEVPTLWMSGENDEKYRSLMEKAREFQPQAECKTIAGAGHRIPLDQPNLVVQHMREFLEKR